MLATYYWLLATFYKLSSWTELFFCTLFPYSPALWKPQQGLLSRYNVMAPNLLDFESFDEAALENPRAFNALLETFIKSVEAKEV